MKILIYKSTSSTSWYASRIGEILTVSRHEINRRPDQGIPEDVYWCRTGDNYNTLNYVRASDATVVLPSTLSDWFGFARVVFAEVTERVATESMGENDERIMEIAEKHGLAKLVKYDPTLHGEVDVEQGSDIWWWGMPNIPQRESFREADRV